MDRGELLRKVSKRLGKRAVVWAGIRGDDIEPLTDLPQLEAAFSIIGEYRNRASIDSLAYETLTGVRVDLETWDIDEHLQKEETAAFRRALLQSLAQPSALLTYRPSRFLSAVSFARRDRTLNLSLFGAHQSMFEHKPWVETAVADLEVAHIPWTYVGDEEQLRASELLADGPVMLRRSRTSGGTGIVRVTDPDELLAKWPRVDEAFVSVAPYIADALPLNIGAVVWDEGVTVHHPSVQLIGIPGCVTRPFGYCGNDFGLVRDLEPRVLDQIESSTRSIGAWLLSVMDELAHIGVLAAPRAACRGEGLKQITKRQTMREFTDAQELKFRLLATGLSISAEARRWLADVTHGKSLTSADYASTSGLILELDDDVWVNAPISDHNPNFVRVPRPCFASIAMGSWSTAMAS
jgi:hypothetical protein